MCDFDPSMRDIDLPGLTGLSDAEAFERRGGLAAEDDGIVVAEIIDRSPAIWPTFVVVISAMGTALVFSGMALVGAAVLSGNLESLQNPAAQASWLAEFASSGFGLSVLVLPGQMVFAAFAIVAALFSREAWSRRLGMRGGRFPTWTWLLFFAGTPVVGLIAAQLMSQLGGEPSEQLKLIERMFTFDSIGSLFLLLLMVGLLPGIVEETLFRGYMQRRLLGRLPAAVSIGVCSIFFAAAHLDPMHAIGVLPLGVWLGVVAWRADSIWPAVFGHVGNNGCAIAMSQMTVANRDVHSADSALVVLMLVSFAAFIGSVAVLVAMGRRGEQDPGTAPELIAQAVAEVPHPMATPRRRTDDLP